MGNAYALLDSAVGLDIDNISDFVDFHVRSEGDHTLQSPQLVPLFPCSFGIV